MEAHGHIPHLREILIFLAAAGIAVPLLQRRTGAVLGYLVLGGLIGPYGLGLLAKSVPLLGPLAITELAGVRALAELGVIFLLFTIGLELSFERLWSLRRLVFGLGSTQIVVTGGAIAMIALAWGSPSATALVLGACLALSSTAIVTQLLIESRRINAPVGRTAFSVLLMQDIAVVPILFVVGIMGSAGAGGVAGAFGLALLEAAAVMTLIYAAGRLLLRPLLRLVARSRSREAFMAIILLIAIGSAALTGYAGLSMALGAFLAGLLIAETEYRHQVEIDIEPFKGLMLGLFFMTVGMGIDWRIVAEEPFWIGASAIGLLALKAAIATILCMAWKLPKYHALEAGMMLSQAGEFAFIVLGVAVSGELIANSTAQFMLIVAGLTMLLTPSVFGVARRLAAMLERRTIAAHQEQVGATDFDGHILIAGFGRVGQTVAAVLDAEEIPYLAIDADPAIVAEALTDRRPVRFGDASRLEVLRKAGVDRAGALVVTLGGDSKATEHLTARMREAAPHVPIYARARDSAHAIRLAKAGATAAIPETIEGSLQLARRVLAGCGSPDDIVQRRLELMRPSVELID